MTTSSLRLSLAVAGSPAMLFSGRIADPAGADPNAVPGGNLARRLQLGARKVS